MTHKIQVFTGDQITPTSGSQNSFATLLHLITYFFFYLKYTLFDDKRVLVLYSEFPKIFDN